MNVLYIFGYTHSHYFSVRLLNPQFPQVSGYPLSVKP